MKPSMSIGRNYRLELEKLLRKVNQSRENTLSSKILDEHCHLIKRPDISNIKCKTKVISNTKTKTYKSSGVVPLIVWLVNNLVYNFSS